jgi:ferredoxin
MAMNEPLNEQEHNIVIDEDKCTGCGDCVEYCQVDAIAVNEDEMVLEVVDLDICIQCHSCQQNCPERAVIVYPHLQEVLR